MFAPVVTTTTERTMHTSEGFNAEEIYTREIAPHLTAIVRICKAHEIPMVAAFLVKANGCDEGLITAALNFKSRHYEPFKRALRAIKFGSGFSQS